METTAKCDKCGREIEIDGTRIGMEIHWYGVCKCGIIIDFWS